MKIATPPRIQVYDTTLRDGAQGAGISFSAAGRVRLACRLDVFGVDYIEGGYAGSNERDMAFFHTMARQELKHARLSAFGSTRRARTPVKADGFVRALLAAGTPVTTVVGKVSRLHVRDVLRTTAAENLAMIADTVGFLKEHGREVIFDAEHFFDGLRDDAEFTLRAVAAAVRAGADVIVLCDTNGGSLPHEIGEGVRLAAGACPGLPLGIHTHNDMGLAVANSLEAVRAGCLQVQGTVNGYGERCGNADLCAIVPALSFKMGRRCLRPGSLRKLRELSLFADDLVNQRHNDKAPYVGANAFTHKAGAHTNAVHKNPRTFEHVDPETVGNQRRIVLSELSGVSSVLLKAVEMGLGRQETAGGVKEILSALKEMESRGYAFEAADASFRMLIQKVLKKHRSFFALEGFRVMVEKRGPQEPCVSEATVKVRVHDRMAHTVGEGDGPVNALDAALRQALIRFYPEIAKVCLTDYQVRILDPEEGTAARTRVLIESSDGTESWGTVGVSENIIEASWEALVDSVEYKLFQQEQAAKSRRGRRKQA